MVWRIVLVVVVVMVLVCAKGGDGVVCFVVLSGVRVRDEGLGG